MTPRERASAIKFTKFTLRGDDGVYYGNNGLDTTGDIATAMKFATLDDAARVKINLDSRFALSFEIVKVVGEPFGTHGVRWHVYSCDLCGIFPGEMEDPTYDEARVLPGGKPLWICESCAKSRIESKMYQVVQ